MNSIFMLAFFFLWQAILGEICPNCNDCSDKPGYSGVLTIQNGFKVNCNQGWTSIMRMQSDEAMNEDEELESYDNGLGVRMKDQVNNDRNWTEYEQGFGNYSANYFTGLKPIANIMKGKGEQGWKLRFFVANLKPGYRGRNMVNATGIYNTFSLDPNDNYRLHVGSFVGDEKNNVLDCSEFACSNNQNEMAFSTRDRFNGRPNVPAGIGDCPIDLYRNFKYGGLQKYAGFWYNGCGHLLHSTRIREVLSGYAKSFVFVGYFTPCQSSYAQHITLKEISLEMHPN